MSTSNTPAAKPGNDFLASLRLYFVHYPTWAYESILPSNRGRPSWSFIRSIQVRKAKLKFTVSRTTPRVNLEPDYRELKEAKNGEGLYIEGVPHLITGRIKQWAEAAGVEAIRLPGYWMYKNDQRMPLGQAPEGDELVYYYIHGGGFVRCSAHPDSFSAIVPRQILNSSSTIRRAFCVEYRLAAAFPVAHGPFPSALIDALAGYVYLVKNVGFSPKNIVVLGDSAGANVALSLIRYLVEFRGDGNVPGLPPPPGSLVLLSPWVDLGTSHSEPGSTFHENAKSDWLPPPLPDGTQGYVARSVTGPHGLDFARYCEYLSPASRDIKSVSFVGFPKTFVTYGSGELFYDQVQDLLSRMVGDMGKGDVSVYEQKDTFHDILGYAYPWCQPEINAVLHQIDKYVSSL